VDIMGYIQLCLSECSSDADCPGTTCQSVGAWGFEVGQVCDCGDDEDCGDGLQCCPIPLLGQSTCLTQCMSF